jgi:hypothetical protein
MVVVYYDADFQQTMIELVRDLGAARNMIRKCRMTARMKAMATTMTPASPTNGTGSDDSDTDMVARIKMQRALRARRTGPDQGGQDSIYERTDKNMEEAQAMCETAAHQFLRDGSCKKELDTARSKLGQALVMATAEVAKAKSMPTPEKKSDDLATTAAAAALVEVPVQIAKQDDDKLLGLSSGGNMAAAAAAAALASEADQSKTPQVMAEKVKTGGPREDSWEAGGPMTVVAPL